MSFLDFFGGSRRLRVFVSHANVDKPLARRVGRRLQRWVAQELDWASASKRRPTIIPLCAERTEGLRAFLDRVGTLGLARRLLGNAFRPATPKVSRTMLDAVCEAAPVARSLKEGLIDAPGVSATPSPGPRIRKAARY